MNLPTTTAVSPAEAFRQIYLNGTWSPQPWNSGTASDPNKEGAIYCLTIAAIINTMGIRSVTDLGTGDGRILAAIASQCPRTTFAGYDCCPELIESLQKTLPHHHWAVNSLETVQDIIDIKGAELILIKDVLHHWPSERIARTLSLMKKYLAGGILLLTQDRNQVSSDQDCELGGYRALSGYMYPLAAHQLRQVIQYHHKAIWRLELPK